MQNVTGNLSTRDIRGRFKRHLLAPADAASLAVFRFAFGLIVSIDAWRYWGKGWITRKWIDTSFNFTYFSQLPVPSDNVIELLTLAWGLSAAFIALGFLYRISVVTFLLSFGYIFLLEKAEYLNHFYFVLLLAFCLLMVPANRIWSLDAVMSKHSTVSYNENPAVPVWSYFLLKGQIEIMLLWAGIVKINADWLAGKPLGEWLQRSAEKAPEFLFPYLSDPEQYGAVFAWGAMFIHLVGAPLLLIPKVRVVMLFVYCGFHYLNHMFWSIGIFPWLAMAGTLIFLSPNWPRLIMARLSPQEIDTSPPLAKLKSNNIMLFCVLVWLLSQALLPTRPWFFSGDAHWTEEGHRFSWRMKLRQKKGKVVFYLVDPATRVRQRVDLHLDLTKRQIRKMSVRPDMIIQYAHFLRDRFEQETGRVPRIYAKALVSLNGRPYYPLIKPRTNLAEVTWSPFTSDAWITAHPDVQPAVFKHDAIR